MGNINVLDSSVFNRIAAGEVVEKPASVVKELVENCIDSSAQKITVTIDKGGRYIKVVDNGCGMSADDLPTAFLPHATSKIHTIKDLDAIGTLGFRGEALPSIASVAKVTVLSRRADDEYGNEIVLENGKQLSMSPKGAPIGTTVIVEDLFKNVPARLKFLRTDRGEEGEITTLMQRLIIANYDKAFTYFVGEKEVFRSDGNGLKDALYAVYGATFLNETEFIHGSMPDIELFGYVSKPAFSKHNKTYQTLIVNGRYVANQDVSFWIYNCFSDFLMKRQYPAYVIFINLPNDMVDINVHPSKMDVKFVDFDKIRRMLSVAIKESFTHSLTEPKIIELGGNDEKFEQKPQVKSVNAESLGKTSSSYGGSYLDSRPTMSITFNSPEAESTESRPQTVDIAQPKARQFELFHNVVSGNNADFKSNNFDLSAYTYCGKLFDTYLIYELGDDAIMIDQHAAHEKLLYDKFAKMVDSGTNSVQDLLVPFVFDVDVKEAEMIDAQIGEIESLGFALNKLSGNAYSLSSVPLILSDMSLNEFAALLVDTLKKNRLAKREFIKDSLMQSACKAAVKGKMNLSQSEIDKLSAAIAENRIELFCPHGRPIAIKIKRGEIEKWFKRIV